MGRAIVIGSKRLGVRVLAQLNAVLSAPHALVGVITTDDRADPRTAFDELRAAAASYGVPFEVADDRGAFDAALQRLRADMAVVAGWYRLIDVGLHREVLFVGFHASLLPRYRGSSPLVWQIIAGEPSIGLSFFQLAAGMDEGRLVAQEARPLGPDETVGDALRWVEDTSEQLLAAHAVALLDGSATLRPQQPVAPSYVGARTPADGLIDWTTDARTVHNFVRAQTRPYPGAFTRLPDGRIVRVWATAVDDRDIRGVPGSVFERREDRVVIACGRGAVWLTEIEIEGSPADRPEALLSSVTLRLS